MLTMTVAQVRDDWGDLIKTVTASVGAQPVEITRTRGRPKDRQAAAESVAVLVPIDWYDALPAGMRPEQSQVRSMKSSEARTSLFDMVEAAIDGVHTMIKAYGRTPVAVVVPHDWYIARKDWRPSSKGDEAGESSSG